MSKRSYSSSSRSSDKSSLSEKRITCKMDRYYKPSSKKRGSSYKSKRRYSYSRSRSLSSRRSRSYSNKRRSYSRSPRISSSRHVSSSRRKYYGNRENPDQSRCLGVFGLSSFTHEYTIREIFSKYGIVHNVKIVLDAKTGKSRGYGFIYYESCEQAKLAKENCSGMDIDGKKIRVDYSITQRPHTPTPGIYMGRPTRLNDERHGGDSHACHYHKYDRDDYYYRSKYSRRSRSLSYCKDRYRREYRSQSRSYTSKERRYREKH